MAHLLQIDLQRAKRHLESLKNKLDYYYSKPQDMPYWQNYIRRQNVKIAACERQILVVKTKMLRAKLREEASDELAELYRKELIELRASLVRHQGQFDIKINSNAPVGAMIETLYIAKEIEKLEERLLKLVERQAIRRANGEPDPVVKSQVTKSAYQYLEDLKAEEEAKKKIMDSANTEGSLDLLR